MNDRRLQYEERFIFGLREIYEQYGYKRFRPRKFEEYDFYAKNKEFLISDQVISFTDTNGKLMALKPDVTLSIIRSQYPKPEHVHKYYYTENVYRVSETSHSFQEYLQMGLECMGDLDMYCISEVLGLAIRSLEQLSKSYVFCISHLGIYEHMMQVVSAHAKRGLDLEEEQALQSCIADKNTHDLARLCADMEIEQAVIEKLQRLVLIHDRPRAALQTLREVGCGNDIIGQLEEVVRVAEVLGLDEHIRIDTSIMDDLNYYHGIIFRGFVEGVAAGVLHGGQYDKLSAKLGKEFGAIGFAIYLDRLGHLTREKKEYDVTNLLIYDKEVKAEILADIQKSFMEESFMMQTSIPKGLKYKKLFYIGKDGQVTLDTSGKE